MHSLLYIEISVDVFQFFFFFKQKTAYEMRISDWSSDVCSSDLVEAIAPLRPLQHVDQLFAGRDALVLYGDARPHDIGRGLRRQRRPAARIANPLIIGEALAQPVDRKRVV